MQPSKVLEASLIYKVAPLERGLLPLRAAVRIGPVGLGTPPTRVFPDIVPFRFFNVSICVRFMNYFR